MSHPHRNVPLDLDSLTSALRAVEPNVVLCPPWFLQSILWRELDLIPTGLAVPDEQICVLPRARYLAFIEDQELPAQDDDLPPGPDLILLERPDSEWLATTPAADVLMRYWRLLTRAEAEARVRATVTEGATESGGHGVDARLERVGRSVFTEARHVLHREKRILNTASDEWAYAKFAAALTELRAFAPSVVTHVFPSVEGSLAAEVVEADVGEELAEKYRPDGAPELRDDAYQPMEPPSPRRGWWSAFWRWLSPQRPRKRRPPRAKRPDKRAREPILSAAERAAEVGNHVRAALLTARAFRAEGEAGLVAPGQAVREINRLADRLQSALGHDDETARRWRESLRALLGPAAAGWWTVESRLLYDLQKVCIDHERKVYSANVIEWLLNLCRKPLFRELPNQRLALAARHLQSALHRLPKCRLTAGQREQFDALLHDALHEADHHLREGLGPKIAAALSAGDLVPRNAVETVGRDAMVHEMLDAILRDGYLTFGGVRDAISRNPLRAHDLRGTEWIGYDQLMKLDQRLGDALDGVYRRGELYRYAFQKLSSLLFASPLSRLITKLVVLPVVGAYILVEGLSHLVGPLVKWITGHPLHLMPDWSAVHSPADLATYAPLAGTVLLLILLINWPSFRHGFGHGVKRMFRGISFVLFELPEKFLRNRTFRAVINSRPTRLVLRYLVKPLIFVAIAWWILPHDTNPWVETATFVTIFLIINLVVNSRPGRAIEGAVLYALRVGWVRFTADVVAHGIRTTVRFFERLVEVVDRGLYAVDEWLRFRGHPDRQSLWGKAILGIFWFYIAYVARFCITLLVEPQINPIKHFPVVTVSHKLLLPLAFTTHMDASLSPLGAMVVMMAGTTWRAANTTAAIVVWGIPGIFGFLAWELKENWKLYRANLPAGLRPVRFGSHGESIAQLLRPGFHSGTLPKAFAKVRAAHRDFDDDQAIVDPTEFPLAVRKHLGAVHHVEEAVTAFVERAFLPLLNRHPLFDGRQVSLAGVKLGATRIDIHLACDDVSDEPLVVEFEQVAGWIVADVPRRGWADRLDAPAKRLLDEALIGLFKMSAVDLVRDDVDAAFAPTPVRWELRPKQLIVRAVAPGTGEAEYSFGTKRMSPSVEVEGAVAFPVLDADAIMIGRREYPLDQWEGLWAEGGSAAVERGEARQPVVVMH